MGLHGQIPDLNVRVTDSIICPNEKSTVIVTIEGVERGYFIYSYLGDSYSKSLTDGFHSFQVSEEGDYTITNYGAFSELGELIFSQDANVQFTISHYNLPTATLSGGGDFCEYDNITPIQASFTGRSPWLLSYILNGSAVITDTFNVSNANITDLPNDHIEIRLLSDDNCQVDVFGSADIEVIPTPDAAIIGDSIFCPEDTSSYITEYNSGYRYLWNIPIGASNVIGGNLEAHNITVQWTESGNHRILLRAETIKGNCSSGILVKDVLVHALPQSKKDYDTIVCFVDKDFITLTPSLNNENTIYWPEYDLVNHTLDITEEGNYAYIETIPFGCADSGAINVLERCIPELYVADAFTPNNDGINDFFNIYGIFFTLDFRIYTSTGAEIFRMEKGGNAWDGTINGEPAMNGTYYWKAEYTNEYGDLYTDEGKIVLYR